MTASTASSRIFFALARGLPMVATCDLPAHLQLLLLFALPKTSDAQIDKIHRLAAGSLDWNAALTLAKHHRIVSSVFDAVERLDLGIVPTAVRQELRLHASANALRTLQSAEEIDRISCRLQAAGFPVAILKGLPLSQMIFGRPNGRQSGDIDLLTSPESIAGQVEILGELGYTVQQVDWDFTPKRLSSFSTHWKGLSFSNGQRCFDLDIHWRLFNNPYHPGNRILDRPDWVTLPIFGRDMRTLTPVDQLNYVAAHGISDGWTYLKSLVDLAGLLQLLDPEDLTASLLKARTCGLEKQVSAAIHVAADLTLMEINHPLLIDTKEVTTVRAKAQLSRTLRATRFQPKRGDLTPVQEFYYEGAMVPGFRSLCSRVARFVWRPRVWALVQLPDSLFFLYAFLGFLLPPREWFRSIPPDKRPHQDWAAGRGVETTHPA